RLALRCLELIDEATVLLVDVYAPVAEVADQDLAAEAAKRKRRPGHAPGRVQRAAAGEAAQQVSVGVEDVDEAVPRARDVVVLSAVLFGVTHEQVTVDVRDAKRGVAWRQVGIEEAAVRGCRGKETVASRGAEDIDRPRVKVGRKQEGAVRV